MLNEQVNRMKNLMVIKEEISKNNLFSNFDTFEFKNQPPPNDNSEETKKEIDFINKIELNKRFVQKKDNIIKNFDEFLKLNGIDEEKLIEKVHQDTRIIILDLKNFYKRPRPFRLDSKLYDPMLKSTEGFAYPSGHSTQSNLICLVLSHKYPRFKTELKKIKDDIVYSRQMANVHYPSDIKFGEKLAKSLFNHLKNNNLIN
jgi:hypothetical protein